MRCPCGRSCPEVLSVFLLHDPHTHFAFACVDVEAILIAHVWVRPLRLVDPDTLKIPKVPTTLLDHVLRNCRDL